MVISLPSAVPITSRSEGWEANLESFHVYFSWDGGRDLERVQLEGDRFEKLWADQMPNVRVFEVPEAVRKKLLRYAPSTQPAPGTSKRSLIPVPYPTMSFYRTQHQKQRLNQNHQRPLTPKQTGNGSIPSSPNLPICIKTQVAWTLRSSRFPFSPGHTNSKFCAAWLKSFRVAYLIADEVGLGKTIETGLVLRYLILSKKVKRVLILAPASVQPQWQEELREKFNLHFWSYLQGELRDPYKQTVPLAANPWNTQNLILASSHLVRRKERMQELLEAEPWDLVVLDEAHITPVAKVPRSARIRPIACWNSCGNCGRRPPHYCYCLPHRCRSTRSKSLTCSALLGLEGHWQYGDNFCHYFATLAAKPDRFSLDFWQQMSTDYFKFGGQACPRLQQHLEQKDRLLTYKLQDLWKQGQKLANPRQLLEDEAFIAASRQYLTVNTPLKDRMFRHTRDTLRQYYRRGLLAHDIPTRQVQDNAIVLEPNQRSGALSSSQ